MTDLLRPKQGAMWNFLSTCRAHYRKTHKHVVRCHYEFIIAHFRGPSPCPAEDSPSSAPVRQLQPCNPTAGSWWPRVHQHPWQSPTRPRATSPSELSPHHGTPSLPLTPAPNTHGLSSLPTKGTHVRTHAHGPTPSLLHNPTPCLSTAKPHHPPRPPAPKSISH